METPQLWKQILARPGDKTLQTQYIAALDQEGDTRGEMFRVAAELRDLVHGSFQRQAELTAQYERLSASWQSEFEVAAQAWNANVRFVVGWPCELTISAPDFTRHAAEIVATIPLRHLNLTAVALAPEVFELWPLSQIASLNASRQPWNQNAIEALANSSHLQSLRWLDLSHTRITDGLIEILAASPQLRGLEHLDLSLNPGRDPVDAAAGCGVDGVSGYIVPESIWLPEFGRELEARYGHIEWLHALSNYMEDHPPSRYRF